MPPLSTFSVSPFVFFLSSSVDVCLSSLLQVFCKQCLESVLGDGPNSACAICRKPILRSKLRIPKGWALPDDEKKGTDASEAKEPEELPVLFDVKVRALIHQIRQQEQIAASERRPAKILVFTQFQPTMSAVKDALTTQRIRFVTIEGHMTMTQRKRALDTFRENRDCRVFLISMRAGAVGLTLTTANVVVMMDVAMNPALEQQAINRVHRIGQTRPVHVYQFVLKGSVEEKIYRLNQNKIVNNADLNAVEERGRKQNSIGMASSEIAELFAP